MAHFYGQQSRYLLINKEVAGILFIVTIAYLTFVYAELMNKWIDKSFSIIYLLGLLTVFIPFAAFFFLLMRRDRKRYYSFNKGLKGESAVWKELHHLDNNYHVFQDVTLPGDTANIDFVIVGPTGIFTIEVKSHTGTIDYNGEQLTIGGNLFEKDILKQACSEAMKLHEYLMKFTVHYPFVHPLIVFSSHEAKMKLGKEKVGNKTFVVNKSWLNDIIRENQESYVLTEKILNLLKKLVDNK